MRRRELIWFLGIAGATAAWPIAARAQQADRTRRIGVLMSVADGDSEGQASVIAFGQRLKELGWTDDRTVRLDIRWGAGDRVPRHRIGRAECWVFACLPPGVERNWLYRRPEFGDRISRGGAKRSDAGGKARKSSAFGSADTVPRYPITGIVACCARAASDQAAVADLVHGSAES